MAFNIKKKEIQIHIFLFIYLFKTEGEEAIRRYDDAIMPKRRKNIVIYNISTPQCVQ